jgi:hypothetical protein
MPRFSGIPGIAKTYRTYRVHMGKVVVASEFDIASLN